MSDIMSDRKTSAVVISTTLIGFLSGFMLGVYAIRGYLISPALAAERRGNLTDPVESEESDIDEDDTILDHAPNWANGEDADRKQGLRMRKDDGRKREDNKKKTTAAATGPSAPALEEASQKEECKLVLVVRTDLGMTKGVYLSHMSTIHPPEYRR